MFYHIQITVTGITSWFSFNLNRDELLSYYICPFVNRERTILSGQIFNFSSFGAIKIYKTDRIVDSNWPIEKTLFKDKNSQKKELDVFEKSNYEDAIEKIFKQEAENVSEDIFKEAVSLIKNHKYENLRERIEQENKEKYAFFICPFDNKKVDHNYEYVIKPLVEKHGYEIQRVDEISHTNSITSEIINAIDRADFIIADLTGEKPNCYYEIGYAHAKGKPSVIIAKKETGRPFDISTYKWNYWEDYKELKPILEKELNAVLKSLANRRQEIDWTKK